MESKLTKKQEKTFGPVKLNDSEVITATVRHDDRFGNGHNTFSITADIRSIGGREIAGGCCHAEVAAAFPELAPFIKWHLCSTDGPMHYIANTVYRAGNRDYNGLKKGEFMQHTSRGKQNSGVEDVPNWELRFPDGMETHVYTNERPAPVTLEWQPCGITGKGKERDFEAARNSAIWPDATDAELSLEPEQLTAKLEARLPALMAEFKAAVESLGFTY